MKKQSQDQTNEQLHIDDAAAAQEEYSLEDIMNEFGGWSKKEEAAPEKPVQKPSSSVCFVEYSLLSGLRCSHKAFFCGKYHWKRAGCL